jgi:3-oxoacyl-[acyl-carrier-protein] synthase III
VAQAVVKGVRFAGLTSCAPRNVVSNLDCPPEKKAERERLVRNIGIQTRRVCDAGVVFSDLALIAAETLIEGLGWRKDEVEAWWS